MGRWLRRCPTPTTTETAIPGLGETSYPDSEITAVHINVPKVLWQAVDAISKRFGTSKTNVAIRALNKEMFFARVRDEDPDAKVVVEHSDGSRENVVFV